MIYKHKQFIRTVTVTNNDIKENIIDLLARKKRESEICNIHMINYALDGSSYRRYRRGKNRCNSCGVRLY